MHGIVLHTYIRHQDVVGGRCRQELGLVVVGGILFVLLVGPSQDA